MLLPYKYTSWVLFKHFLLKSKHPIKIFFRKIWAESIKNINKGLQLLLDFSQKQKPIQDYYTSLSHTLCIYEAAESSIFLEISEDLFRIEISHFIDSLLYHVVKEQSIMENDSFTISLKNTSSR